MIGQKFNFDDVFFRDLTVCVLDTLEGRLNWINRFSSGDVSVSVPIYYSMTGDDRFLLDSFQDDIVSENRYVELNTDQIPRGHLTLTNFNIRSDEFRNPNVWLRSVVEDDTEVKKLLKQVRAIPITATYDLTILLKNEVDIFKCSQEIMNTLWLYRFMYFEYNYMNIDAIMLMPDTETIQIQREKNLKSDDTVKLTLSIEVQTYYPSFVTSNQDKVRSTVTKTTSYSILQISSTAGISVGQFVIGPGIPSNTTVTSIDVDNRYISTSSPILNIYSGQNISFSSNVNNFYESNIESSIISVLNTSTIQVSSTTGISVGQYIIGPGIPSNTTVTSINFDNRYISTSSPILNISPGQNISFSNSNIQYSITSVLNPSTIQVPSTTGISVGQYIIGPGIPSNTTVTSINFDNRYISTSSPILNISPGQNISFSSNSNIEYSIDGVFSPYITLNNVVGIQVGDVVSSVNSSTFIPDSVSVIYVNPLNNSIILNKNPNFIQNQNISISGNPYNVLSGNNIINLTTTKDIQVGQKVSGDGISSSTKVIEVNEEENYVICSKPVTISPNQVVFFSFNNNIVDSIIPYKTRWFSNLYQQRSKKKDSLNPNAILNNNNPNFNS